MLVAQNKKGVMFSMTNEWTRDALISLRNDEVFQCPVCKEVVLLRIGEQRIPHFAHSKSTQCESFSEPESAYHLNGKLQLYQWLNNQAFKPVLEPYLKIVKQRPDLYLPTHPSNPVIEYQCSTIDSKQFKERTDGYLLNGYQPIWILGGKRLKRLDQNQFSLSPFDWMFTRLTHQKPCLLYYCSESNNFLLLHNLLPLSASKATGNLEILSPSETSFSDLLIRKLDGPFPAQQWLTMKRSWRLNCTQYPSHNMKKLLTFLYQKQIYPSLLPSEVGIPVPSMYWIQTSPIVWQAWILIEYIENLPFSIPFSFQAVYDYFNKKKRNQPFYLRELPLIANRHYSFAIMEYLHALVEMGILTRINRKTFIRKEACHYPKNLEEALQRDSSLLIEHKKLFI
ncbi:competence protein CoiA [Bacillus sp. AK128]